MSNKPISVSILDVLLTLRNIESNLLTVLEKSSLTSEDRTPIEDALESHVPPNNPEETIDDIFVQLNYIEDAIHCMVPEIAVKVTTTVSQYLHQLRKE